MSVAGALCRGGCGRPPRPGSARSGNPPRYCAECRLSDRPPIVWPIYACAGCTHAFGVSHRNGRRMRAASLRQCPACRRMRASFVRFSTPADAALVVASISLFFHVLGGAARRPEVSCAA